MKTDTSSALPLFNTHAPTPSLHTCVKSLDTIDLLPPLCSDPSIFWPTQLSPKVVTFCMYGERVVIHVLLSSGPQPGSNETNAPPVGLLYNSKTLGGLRVPFNPLVVMSLTPVEFLQ